jgi:hypothetical protein
MTADKTVTATFTPRPSFILTVAGTGWSSGYMFGTGIGCDYFDGLTHGDCTEPVPGGLSISVIALPDGHFNGWFGCTSTSTTYYPNDTCHVTITSHWTITAAFGESVPCSSLMLSDCPPNGDPGLASTRHR